MAYSGSLPSTEKLSFSPSLEVLMLDTSLFEEPLLKRLDEDVISSLGAMYGIYIISLMNTAQMEFLFPFRVQPHTLYSHCEGYIVDDYEAGIYVVDSYEWYIILGITLMLCINCGITLV